MNEASYNDPKPGKKKWNPIPAPVSVERENINIVRLKIGNGSPIKVARSFLQNGTEGESSTTDGYIDLEIPSTPIPEALSDMMTKHCGDFAEVAMIQIYRLNIMNVLQHAIQS